MRRDLQASLLSLGQSARSRRVGTGDVAGGAQLSSAAYQPVPHHVQRSGHRPKLPRLTPVPTASSSARKS